MCGLSFLLSARRGAWLAALAASAASAASGPMSEPLRRPRPVARAIFGPAEMSRPERQVAADAVMPVEPAGGEANDS